MKSQLRAVVLAIVVISCALSTSGCLVILLLGSPVFGRVGSDGKSVLTTFIEFVVCDEFHRTGDTAGFVSCTESFSDGHEVSPEYVLQNLPPGTSGLQLFFDPLIAQFPANVGGFSGTFSGPTTGALVIEAGLSCVNTVPGAQLCAEPGQQIVVLDVPAGTPFGTYNLSLNFTVTPASAIVVRPIITGKIVTGGKTFYPLMAPCVTSFANAPAVTVPLSNSSVGIPVDVTSVQACKGTFDFALAGAGAQSIPTLGQSGLLALILLIVLVAVYALSTRRKIV